MLRDFISSNREELISRAKGKVSARISARPPPAAPSGGPEHGVPLFLAQLAETLLLEATATPLSPTAIGATAARRGGELLAEGYTLSQVVHEYAGVSQAITELAVERGTPISPGEFHTLNRSLDTAIAEAVSEYGRLQEEASSRRDLERRGRIAHELRNVVQTALLSFRVLEAGRGGSGAPGGVLGRSLVNIRDLVEGLVSDVCLAATGRRHDRVSLLQLVQEIAIGARLHAEYREIRLIVEPVDPALAVDVDAGLLASAAMNLVHNAFQYTRAHGQVTIRARAERGRAFIEVEDECGGLKAGDAEPGPPSADRRGRRRSGLGLGLSLSRRAVTANGGEIHSRNLPGRGCIFSIELPLSDPPAG
jgi:signal transduction histidine kinase